VCFDDLRDNRIKPRRARWAFPWRYPGVDAGLQERVAFLKAYEAPANLFRCHLLVANRTGRVDLCRLRCRTKGSLMPRLNPARCRVQIGRPEALLASLPLCAHSARQQRSVYRRHSNCESGGQAFESLRARQSIQVLTKIDRLRTGR
jgi:hypothetical protein